MLPDIIHRHFTRLMLLGIVLGMTACAAPGDDYHHGRFDARDVHQRGLVVLGVTSSMQKEPLYRSMQWSKILGKAVRKQRGHYPLVQAEKLRDMMGSDYATVLASVQKHNELGREELALIRRAPLLARYAMVAQLQGDTLEHPPKREVPVEKNGEVRSDRVAVVLSSRRRVTVLARVYDLDTGKLVWQRSRSASPVNETEYTVYKGDSFSEALTVATLNTLKNGSLTHKNPDFPTFASAFGEAVTLLAAQLPGNP
jgi:hypothetical protein